VKKILFLGGAIHQIPVLVYAREQGYYSILCDFLPDNPGQHYADAFFCISTTDQEAVLRLARAEKIDGIVAYASDPAASVAAYVGNCMGLPSNPYDAVQTLVKKDLFRDFLLSKGFNCPKAKCYKDVDHALLDLSAFRLPVILKPTDASGSKGVRKVEDYDDFTEAFHKALDCSREGKVIVEEFIEMNHEHMIAGDAFVMDGKLVFTGLLNSHRNHTLYPFIPIGTSYPIKMNEIQKKEVYDVLQKIIELLKLNYGALNLEFMYGQDDKLYIIEIGPRNGGNLIPDFLKMIHGIDMIKATVEVAIGNYSLDMEVHPSDGYYATYVLQTPSPGTLAGIIYDDRIKNNITKQVLYKEIGEEVGVFNGSNKAVGILFLEFGDVLEMDEKMNSMDQLVHLELK
jgi:biotin carboxylase